MSLPPCATAKRYGCTVMSSFELVSGVNWRPCLSRTGTTLRVYGPAWGQTRSKETSFSGSLQQSPCPACNVHAEGVLLEAG